MPMDMERYSETTLVHADSVTVPRFELWLEEWHRF